MLLKRLSAVLLAVTLLTTTAGLAMASETVTDPPEERGETVGDHNAFTDGQGMSESQGASQAQTQDGSLGVNGGEGSGMSGDPYAGLSEEMLDTLNQLGIGPNPVRFFSGTADDLRKRVTMPHHYEAAVMNVGMDPAFWERVGGMTEDEARAVLTEDPEVALGLTILDLYYKDQLIGYTVDPIEAVLGDPDTLPDLNAPRPHHFDVGMAAIRMYDLGLISGRDGGDLALESSLTRAELVAIMMRAMGFEQEAGLMKGAMPFSDVSTHWADGYLALAKGIAQENGFEIGYPDGTFHPDEPVTEPQVIAFAVKFLKVPRADAPWPNDYIDGARAAGLLPPTHQVRSEPSTRAMALYVMDHAFSGPDGVYIKNLAKYKQNAVLPDGPIIDLADEAEAAQVGRVTITGRTTGAQVVLITSDTFGRVVFPEADGSFTVEVPLPEGDNGFTATAIDILNQERAVDFSITHLPE